MMYAVVCSGAYGVETMVSGAGPGITLLVLVLLPFVYSMPIALTSAELTARYPVEGGQYRWARLAFGDTIGYMSGWLTWLAMFATIASIAVLFTTYLGYFVSVPSGAARAACSACVVWLAVFLNYRGIDIVGRATVLLTVIIVIPFVLMTGLGFAQWQYNPVQPFTNPDVPRASALVTALLVAMWLYGGFEKLSVAAEEVEAPSRSFPLAFAIAVPLCAITYIAPTVAGLAAGADWREWTDAYYVTVAGSIGGPWLGTAMAAGALLSNFGIVMTTMLSQSRLPMVLAEDGLFPPVFRRRHERFGTPTVSLVVGGVILTALCTMPFASLVGAAALVQSLSYLLMYAALLKLRGRPDDRAGSTFRIPLGRAGLAVLIAPSVLIVMVVVWFGLLPDGRLLVPEAALGAALLASGPMTYLCVQRYLRFSAPAARPEIG